MREKAVWIGGDKSVADPVWQGTEMHPGWCTPPFRLRHRADGGAFSPFFRPP
jgi:hypothetical protein